MLFFITLLAYFIGSFPTAYLVARLVYGTDVRQSGSGNVGTFNFIRTTQSRFWGVVVLLVDVAKGFVALLLAARISEHVILIFPAVAVVVGHVYPVWLRFRGGRGLATLAGVFLYLKPVLVLVWLIIFAFTYLVSKKYILAAVLALILTNGIVALYFTYPLFLISSATTVIVLMKYAARLKQEINQAQHANNAKGEQSGT